MTEEERFIFNLTHTITLDDTRDYNVTDITQLLEQHGAFEVDTESPLWERHIIKHTIRFKYGINTATLPASSGHEAAVRSRIFGTLLTLECLNFQWAE